MSQIVEVPAKAFLALVESYISGEYRVYLVVERILSVKETFSCKEKGCGKPFDAWSPDTIHTVPRLEPTEDAIPRSYKCPDGHENTIYWLKGASGKVFMKTD